MKRRVLVSLLVLSAIAVTACGKSSKAGSSREDVATSTRASEAPSTTAVATTTTLITSTTQPSPSSNGSRATAISQPYTAAASAGQRSFTVNISAPGPDCGGETPFIVGIFAGNGSIVYTPEEIRATVLGSANGKYVPGTRGCKSSNVLTNIAVGPIQYGVFVAMRGQVTDDWSIFASEIVNHSISINYYEFDAHSP